MKDIFIYLLSFYFIMRGFLYLTKGRNWGWVVLIIGIGIIAFKIYEALQKPQEEWNDEKNNE